MADKKLPLAPHSWVDKFMHWLEEWKFDSLVMGPIFLVLIISILAAWDGDALSATIAALIYISPIWLPVILFVVFWTSWIHYVRYAFWFTQKHTVIQVELPPEVEKSPLAVELFLAALWNSGGEPTFIARIWKGTFRAIWSLEIASNEGRIHYYIHLREWHREVVEARLYGQFPEAKITVLDEDYAANVPFTLDTYDLFGGEFMKGSSQPIPLKTYVDYGLDKSPDTPEIQVDPLTHVLEIMGATGKDEHFWLQFIIKARKKDEWYGFYREGWFKKDSYKDAAKEAVESVTKGAIDRATKLTSDPAEQKKVGARGAMLLNEIEREKITAIERSQTKLLFECGIRAIYLAKKDRFRAINAPGIINLFRPFQKQEWNSLVPGAAGQGTMYVDYPWQDFANIRTNREKRQQFFRYKHRAYFYVPYDQTPNFLTTEELATLWHFPSSVVKTPALSRVPSRRADAPANLPVGAPVDLPR